MKTRPSSGTWTACCIGPTSRGRNLSPMVASSSLSRTSSSLSPGLSPSTVDVTTPSLGATASVGAPVASFIEAMGSPSLTLSPTCFFHSTNSAPVPFITGSSPSSITTGRSFPSSLTTMRASLSPSGKTSSSFWPSTSGCRSTTLPVEYDFLIIVPPSIVLISAIGVSTWTSSPTSTSHLWKIAPAINCSDLSFLEAPSGGNLPRVTRFPSSKIWQGSPSTILS
mmetsp:Transcript_93785/g.186011  ORF Transcript_93785/g.186011 Transcript_93785/m.186011 type:complete len:224 (-) Transcript_93785:454-1125(-)